MTRLARISLAVGGTMLVLSFGMLAVSLVLWDRAERIGPDGAKMIADTLFIGRVSMLALVFAAVSGVGTGVAAIIAALPTDTDPASSP